MTSAPVIVKPGKFGMHVFAKTDLEQGQLVLSGWGPESIRRTQHSFQVELNRHIIIRNEIELINHSCEPNCGMLIQPEAKRVEIHALKPIAAGSELLTDYATFELEIAHMPAKCQCGSAGCRKNITGFYDLSDETIARLGPYIAPYLRHIHANRQKPKGKDSAA